MNSSNRQSMVRTARELASETGIRAVNGLIRRIGERILRDAAADPSLEQLGAAMFCVGEAWDRELGSSDRVEAAFKACGVLYGYARDRRERSGSSRGFLIHEAHESLRSLAKSRRVYLRGLAYGSAVTEADAAEAVERCAVLARQLASERQQSAALRAIADAVESGLGARATGEEIAELQTLVLAALRAGVQASRTSLLEVLRPVMPRLESAEGLAFPLCGCVAAWKAKQAADRRRLGSRGRGGDRTRGNPAGGGRGCTRKTIRGMKRAGLEVQPKRRTGEVVVRDPQSGRRVVMHAGRKDASRKLRSMWDSVNRPHRRRAA